MLEFTTTSSEDDREMMAIRMPAIRTAYTEAMQGAHSVTKSIHDCSGVPKDWPPMQSAFELKINGTSVKAYVPYIEALAFLREQAEAGANAIKSDARKNLDWAVERNIITKQSADTYFEANFNA